MTFLARCFASIERCVHTETVHYHHLPPQLPYRHDAYDDYRNCVNKRGWLGTLVGGGLLGSGMRLSGACPGTVWVQLGAGIPFASYTIAGGFVGGLLYKSFEASFLRIARVGKFPHTFVHEWVAGEKATK